MADKSINELPVAPKLTNEGLMVVYQDSQTNSIKGQTIANFARESTAADVQRAVDAANAAETSAQEAADKATEAKNLATKPPYINTTTGTWWIWNETNSTYVDSTVDATMSFTVGTVTTGDPGTEATITNVGTDTDPVLNFVIPKGDTGAPGGVVSFNGRNGVVNPEANDYDVSDIEGLSEALASKVPNWSTTNSFPANAVCAHAGKIWTNTSGAPSTGVTPGTDYSVWNVPYSNRNLLDNWDFRNPVNQRGQTGYSGNSIYTIDRMYIDANCILTVNNGYISLTTNALYAGMLQNVDGNKIISGKSYTISYLLSGGIASHTFIANNDGDWHESFIITPGMYFTIRYNPTTDTWITYLVEHSVSNESIINLYAVKLESGSVSTLANDPPADYGEELRKCQRYYQKIDNAFGYGYTVNGSEALIDIPVPVTMRTTPAITAASLGYLSTTSAFVVTALSVSAIKSNAVRLLAAGTGWSVSTVAALSGAAIALSADL